jgi:hypothetical protein
MGMDRTTKASGIVAPSQSALLVGAASGFTRSEMVYVGASGDCYLKRAFEPMRPLNSSAKRM